MKTLSLSLLAASPLLAQLQWQPESPPVAPGSPRGVAVAFDDFRARTVLFGGCGVDYPFTAIVGASNSTWEWDGREWLLRAPAVSPSPRFFHSMAYDVARRRMVMFGGRDGNGVNPVDTTWEYDGITWTNMTPASGPVPVPREVAAIAYDAARGETVLFGGSLAGSAGHFADTWTWNGVLWTQKAPPQAPQGRFGHAMCYDAPNARALMFGGTINGGFVNDLWSWNGSNWTQLPSLTPPPAARHYHAMAADPTRGQVLLFSGNPGGWQPPLADTWLWNGTSWSQLAASPAPSARNYPAMTFDRVRREYVLFGGEDLGAGPYGNVNDTWVHRDTSAWFAGFGAGCPGASGTPALGTLPGMLPTLGSVFTVAISQIPSTFVVAWLGNSVSQSGVAALPLDLTPLGMPGCTLWVDPMIPQVLVSSCSSALWSFCVPNAPPLIGLHLYFQAAVPDPTAPPLGITISNAAAATIGL